MLRQYIKVVVCAGVSLMMRQGTREQNGGFGSHYSLRGLPHRHATKALPHNSSTPLPIATP